MAYIVLMKTVGGRWLPITAYDIFGPDEEAKAPYLFSLDGARECSRGYEGESKVLMEVV